MILHKILLDSVEYKTKPNTSEFRRISNRISSHPENLDIVSLSEQVTQPYGRSWTPGYISGKRKKENWKSQSIFGLDFDGGIIVGQVLERLKNYGLDCTFIYSTFSSCAETPKFRVVWQLNQVIIERNFWREIQSALYLLFPEADKACEKDESRIFLGGQALVYTNYEYYLDLDVLIEAASFHAVKNSSNKNMSRNVSRIRSKLGLNRNGSNNNSSYINNKGNAVFASKKVPSTQIVRGVDFEDLRKKVSILDDFMKPDEKLLHPQLLGLATNLRYIEGGQRLFEKIVTSNPDYDQEEKLKIMTYCKSCDYLPMSLERFSPYEDDWGYGNLLHAAQKKKIVRLCSPKTLTVNEARQNLKEKFAQIIDSCDTNIHVIKGFTGIGKTELFSKLENALIALPYHSLKGEIAQSRMKISHMATPSLDMLPNEVRVKLNYFYSIGATSQANQYISEQSETNGLVKNYLETCLACYASSETVLTTHQKAIFIPSWLQKTIIFDEDIISSLMPIAKVTLNDLVRLEASLEDRDDKLVITSLINDIRNGEANTPRQLGVGDFRNFNAIEDEVLDNGFKYESNILHFFKSQYYIPDPQDAATIYYICKHELPEDKKIVVLSATADETMYRYLFGDRVKFYDISNVKPVGLIEQDTTYSFSQSTFTKHLDYALEKVGDLPVITFARFKSNFSNPIEDMHFGYCSGSDKYNGQDIAVIGTPHVNPITIALYAKVLGLAVEAHDFSIKQQEINRNGFRFWFNAFDSEKLRDIQFYFIETGLKQAIGRGRPYTMPCTVKLYSNYPLPESSIDEAEQELGRKILQQNIGTHLEHCFEAPSTDSEHMLIC